MGDKPLQLPDNPNVNDPKQRSQGDSFFGNKTLFPKVPSFPMDLAGAVAWADLNQRGEPEWEFTRLFPQDDNKVNTDFASKIIFQSIVDSKFAAGANYLSVATGNLAGQDKAELIVENVFRVRGRPFNTPEVQTALKNFMSAHAKTGRQFYYFEAMQYSTIKYRIFKKVEASAKATGVFVGVDGSMFY
jgi:hypothetical protein